MALAERLARAERSFFGSLLLEDGTMVGHNDDEGERCAFGLALFLGSGSVELLDCGGGQGEGASLGQAVAAARSPLNGGAAPLVPKTRPPLVRPWPPTFFGDVVEDMVGQDSPCWRRRRRHGGARTHGPAAAWFLEALGGHATRPRPSPSPQRIQASSASGASSSTAPRLVKTRGLSDAARSSCCTT